MRPLALLALLLAMSALGCDRWAFVRTPPLAVRLAGGATEGAFTHAMSIATERGYTVEFSDPVYGVIGLRARQPPGRDATSSLIVQCYADGHATVSVLGPRVTGTEDVRRAPIGLAREAVALAQALDVGADPE